MVSKQQSLSHYNPNLISSPQLSPFEMDVPEHLEALGSRLTVRIRLSPHLLLSNMSEFPQTGINTRELYLQLGIHERTGDLAMLTQEKLKKTISTNWQDVSLTIYVCSKKKLKRMQKNTFILSFYLFLFFFLGCFEPSNILKFT